VPLTRQVRCAQPPQHQHKVRLSADWITNNQPAQAGIVHLLRRF
jgi:hypothetical protein